MFCFRVGSLLDELQKHAADVLEAVRVALEQSRLSISGSRRCLRLDAKQFAAVPDISIDYALMERSERVATYPATSAGAISVPGMPWASSPRRMPAATAEGEVLVHGAHNNYVQSPERLTAPVGVEDLIVVDTPMPCWSPTRIMRRTSSTSSVN